MAFLAETATGLLEDAQRQGRLGHAYLLSGASRAAQEGVALKLAAMVAGQGFDDLDEVTAAGGTVVRPESKSRRIKIEQMREMERRLNLGGDQPAKRVGVVVDADRLQPEAANAFLKTLEEPPPGVLLLLLTLYPDELLDTVLSRCIRVPLYGGGAGAEREADEAELLELLGAQFGRGAGGDWSVGGAIRMKNGFAAVLAAVKGEIADELKGEFKEEQAQYKQRTEGDWLDKREKYYEALTEARYLQRRAVLIGLLGGWFGDALRQKLGLVDAVEYPEYAEVTRALGERTAVDVLVQRADGAEFLRRQLETNVQEALALEVGFLKMFG